MKLAPTITTMARMSIPRWRVFGAACLAHVLHDGYSSMLYLLLPFWQRELALSLTQVGILKTVYSAAMAFGQVPAGRLGERWSERLPLAAGTLLTAAAVVALHWATTRGLLLTFLRRMMCARRQGDEEYRRCRQAEHADRHSSGAPAECGD
jgi:MFS family permease